MLSPKTCTKGPIGKLLKSESANWKIGTQMCFAPTIPTNPAPRVLHSLVCSKPSHHLPDLTTAWLLSARASCHPPPPPTKHAPPPPQSRNFLSYVSGYLSGCDGAMHHRIHPHSQCVSQQKPKFLSLKYLFLHPPPPSHNAVQNNCLIFPSTNYPAKSFAQPPNHIEVFANVFVKFFSRERTSVATKRIFCLKSFFFGGQPTHPKH